MIVTSRFYVQVQGKHMAIHFPYDMKLIEVVRTLPDRNWNDKVKGAWSVPFTSFHCAQLIDALKQYSFQIDPEIIKCADAKATRPVKIGKTLPKELYPYQREAVQFGATARGRFILADAPGVGKTAPALVWTYMFGGKKVLIVAPANVTYKWAEKEVPMWAKGMTTQVVEGGKKPLEDVNILIMSYRTMVMRYEELKELPFDTMIFDEAHYLNSNKSQQNKVARKLVKGLPYLLFLTGTAFKNSRFEMFQMLHMLDPIAWPDAIKFGVRYCGGQFANGAWITPPNGETNTEELLSRLSSYMIRRTKKQVLKDLPDLTRVSLPITADNMREYETALRSAKETARAEGYQPGRSLALLNTLRQVVGRGKVGAVIEQAKELLDAGEQVVIHAHHKEVVAALVKQLIVNFVPSGVIAVIDGSTAAKDRQLLSQDFLEGYKRVMVISSAGKEGLDLYSASHLIMAERQWTAADEEQIEGRLHRNGQKNAVTVYYPIAKGTIDGYMDDIVRGKRAEFSHVNAMDPIREIFNLMFMKGDK